MQRSTRALVRYPKIGHPFSKRLRRVLVRRFPYGLLYRLDAERIFVVAVPIFGDAQDTGDEGDLPNPRLQRAALRAAAEPPGRSAVSGRW